MYYRYKAKNKRGKYFKFLFYFVLISFLIGTVYNYRQYLYFWKYSRNKLILNIDNTVKIRDKTKRKDELQELARVLDQYKNDNMTSHEAFLLSGKIRFYLGETYLPGSFSEMFISESGLKNLPAESRNEFTRAIRDIKKGESLNDAGELKPEFLFYLALSSYYNGFFGNDEIFSLIKNIDPAAIKDSELVRFASVINILGGKVEYGLTLLSDKGGIHESDQGKLFLAVVQRLGKQYTNAIMNLKDLLNKTTDSGLLKIINYNLGLIYYNQSLFKESMEHFNNCYKIDDRDFRYRLWIGKVYSAMGDNAKAKAVWNDILSSDRNNEEAKKLLGVM